MGFNEAFVSVKELVNDFRENEKAFLKADYSEADVRNDFINKFFIALGWDVRHEQQKNPYEQEVRVEKPVLVAKAQKRADYTFYLSPNFRDVKFFVEAKKPHHDLENKDYYFQTVRYGWNANTRIAVLTDFEEFIILDCRFKPDIKDILNFKLKSFDYSDYANEDKFREIYFLFSREAVAESSIEKYADSLPKPKGKKLKAVKTEAQTIDESFLEELDEIRTSLAKSFKKNNSHLTSEELTEATQRTIDRLVFIKFLEDKMIEPHHYVSTFASSLSLTRRGTEGEVGIKDKGLTAWEKFVRASITLDAKYNGVVFKKSLIDTRNLIEPDDKTFSQICEELSHENTPYNFDAIPIHILGSIYERFLGKVVNATDKRVTIDEKPEVRKAGGVYYTPQYIVNYIVDNTIGKLIADKTPKEIAKMRFADIACGSGSFLITVYERLLDYHKRWYIEHPEQAKKDGCILYEGAYRLSLQQKKDILTNNIYGVDLDHQAVEVTQLSLYLKLLEDETTATANDTWVMFKEQLLPDLSRNIVNGNSLIGTDILNPTLPTGQAGLVLPFGKGEETGGVDELKLKPMDFDKTFPDVMAAGGFDAIVGNPPYLSFHEGNKTVKSYYKKFKSAEGKYDHYILFTEKSLQLLRSKGLFGYIIPNKFIHSNYGEGIKKVILLERIIKIIDFKDKKVFKDATNYPCILLIQKNGSINEFTYDEVKNLEVEKFISESIIIKQNDLTHSTWILINDIEKKFLKRMMSDFAKLETVADQITQGLRTGDLEVFYNNINVDNNSIEIEKELLRLVYHGKNVKRYQNLIDSKKDNLCFPYKEDKKTPININDFPKARLYLENHRSSLLLRKDSGKIFKETKKKFYEYWDSKPICFNSPKIIFPDISNQNNFYLDTSGLGYLNTCYAIFLKENHYKYFLGILNSKLIEFIIKKICPSVRGGYYRYKTNYLKQLPIPIIENQDSNYKIVVTLVDQMLTSKKQLLQAKTESDKNYLARKCEQLDKEIDALVYQLYGLTEEEVKIVEGTTSS